MDDGGAVNHTSKQKHKINYPSPPKFFDNPDVPFGPSGPSPVGGKEKVRLGKNSRERFTSATFTTRATTHSDSYE